MAPRLRCDRGRTVRVEIKSIGAHSVMFMTYNVLPSFCYQQHQDVERTVGINTAYIGTTDFNLESADKEFIIEVREMSQR